MQLNHELGQVFVHSETKTFYHFDIKPFRVDCLGRSKIIMENWTTGPTYTPAINSDSPHYSLNWWQEYYRATEMTETKSDC